MWSIAWCYGILHRYCDVHGYVGHDGHGHDGHYGHGGHGGLDVHDESHTSLMYLC